MRNLIFFVATAFISLLIAGCNGGGFGNVKSEPNNSFFRSQMLSIPVNGLPASVDQIDDPNDYYIFSAVQGQRYKFHLEQTEYSADVDMYLFDPGRQLMVESTGRGLFEDFSYRFDKGGLWYLLVYAYEGRSSYFLTITEK